MTIEPPGRPAVIGESHARPDALGQGHRSYGLSRRPDPVRHAACGSRVLPSSTARVVAIDATRALAIPGVHAVLTAADVPFNAFGLIRPDQPVLVAVGDEVRFSGDKVAIVIAERLTPREREPRP